MKNLAPILWTLIVCILIGLYVINPHNPRTSDLAVAHDTGKSLPLHLSAARGPSPSSSKGSVGDGQSFTPGSVDPPDDPTPPLLGGSDGSGGVFPIDTREEIEPGMLPTVDGLYELTVARFMDEEFLALTPARARELLPVDDEIPDSSLPGSLVQALGIGLPTYEDCVRGFQRLSVKRLLTQVQTLSLAATSLEMTPIERRTKEFTARLEELERNRATLTLALMHELDCSTGYKSWSLLWSVYSEWVK